MPTNRAPCTRRSSACSPRSAFKAAVARLEGDHERIVEETIRLQQIPAPCRQEGEKARAFAQMFRQHGLAEVEIDPEGNVLGLRKGSGARRELVAMISHLDTVFARDTPLAVRREGSRIYGPGLADNTHSLAGMLALLRALDAAGLAHQRDILFVGSVGEEGLGDLRGVKYLFGHGRYRDRIGLVLSHDGSKPGRIVNGALGSRRYRVTFRGPGGHSYNAFGLVNPMFAMAGAVAALAAVKAPPGASYNVGVTAGGTSINAIPREVWIEVDLRSPQPDDLARLDAQWLQIVDQAVRAENEARSIAEGAITTDLELVGERPSGVTDPDHEIVRIAVAAMAAHGFEPELRTASTDSNVPISKGIPAITIPGGIGGNEHSLQEFIDVDPAANLRQISATLAILLAVAGIVD